MKTLLIDSSYLCYKSMHSFGGLTHEKVGTGIIFGFMRDVKTLAHKFKSNRFVFLWDSKQSKRAHIYPEYKNPRKKKRQELSDEEKCILEDAYRQFDVLRKETLPAFGFKNNFLQEGYEADDFFGVIVKKRKNCIMITPDEDMFQLLDYAPMYSPRTDKLHTAKSFEKDKKITPKQWVDVKKIGGCRSDNVLGIVGVAEKTAIRYLKGELKHKTKAYHNIITGSDIIQRNQKLVELPFEGIESPKILKNKLSVKKFRKVCKSLAFYSFIENKDFKEWKNIIEGKF